MSTSATGGSASGSAPGGSGTKKLSDCVRPGVLEVRARRDWPVSALISVDLPTLERPENATSGGPSGGKAATVGASVTKRQGWRKTARGVSILCWLITLHWTGLGAGRKVRPE